MGWQPTTGLQHTRIHELNTMDSRGLATNNRSKSNREQYLCSTTTILSLQATIGLSNSKTITSNHSSSNPETYQSKCSISKKHHSSSQLTAPNQLFTKLLLTRSLKMKIPELRI